MSQFVELEPGVYRVVRNEKNHKVFDLQFIKKRYHIKKKIYGQVHKLLYRITRKVELKILYTLSVLFLGKKGMGKTTTMEYLSNKLIDSGMPVIEIKYLTVNVDLIDFISKFRNVVISIDEFGKYFSQDNQDKMLTLLNYDPDYPRVFFLGENEAYKISQYIIDRMERARYFLYLDRIKDEDLSLYCDDNNFSADMKSSLLTINKKTSSISYDTLSVLADEHSIFPELGFDELTEVMNCQGILGVPVMEVQDIILESETEHISTFDIVSSSVITRTEFIERGNRIYVDVTIKSNKTDEVKEEKSIPPASPYAGIPQFGGGSNDRFSIAIQSNDKMVINDIDDSISLTIVQRGHTFLIHLKTKIMAKNLIR